MTAPSPQLPLVGLLLPLLAVVALLSATPDHLVVGLAAAAVVVLTGHAGAAPLRARVVSVQVRSEVCRCSGVRSTDPDRPGRARPRAPGRG